MQDKFNQEYKNIINLDDFRYKKVQSNNNSILAKKNRDTLIFQDDSNLNERVNNIKLSVQRINNLITKLKQYSENQNKK